MKRFTHAMLVAMTAFLVSSALLAAQAKPAAQPAAKPATQAPAPPAARARLVAPVRGDATIEVTRPATKRDKNDVVTVIKVKNVSAGSIAGLRVQEFWYDKAGNVVTGNDERLRTPLPPSGIYTFTLRTPYIPAMNGNNYTFTHANGKIKTKPVQKIDEPK